MSEKAKRRRLEDGRQMEARWGAEWLPATVLGPLGADAYEVEIEVSVPGTVRYRVRRARRELRYIKPPSRRKGRG